MSTLYVNTISPKSGDTITFTPGLTTTGSLNAGRFSGSSAQSSVLLGDLIVATKNGTAASLYVSGNLTVAGTTTAVSTTNTIVKDSLIELNNGAGSNSNDCGIVIERGSTGDNAAFIWDENADTFQVGTTTATGASTGNLTVTDAAFKAGSLDISGDVDIDGTTNLDAVDIDGAVQIDSTVTVGANDQGYDVIFYGDTASANMTWDTSADDLIFNGTAGLIVPDGKLTLGSTAVSSTAAELNKLDGADSNVTAAKLSTLSALTDAEIGYVDGAGTSVVASKALIADSNKDVGTIRNLTIDGTFSDGNYTFDTSGNVTGLGTIGCGAITSTSNLQANGTLSLNAGSNTITAAELNVLDGITAGTAAASKAFVLDSNGDITIADGDKFHFGTSGTSDSTIQWKGGSHTLSFDNHQSSGKIEMVLGADANTSAFRVLNNSESTLFEVNGVGQATAIRLSQSTAQSNVYLGDVVLGSKNGTAANLRLSGNVSAMAIVNPQTLTTTTIPGSSNAVLYGPITIGANEEVEIGVDSVVKIEDIS